MSLAILLRIMKQLPPTPSSPTTIPPLSCMNRYSPSSVRTTGYRKLLPEDLLFLASQVLDGNEIYHFDLLLGALVQWDRQQDTKQISQWTPILQRAYKLLMSGGSSRNGLLDQLMATFLLDYAKLLVKRFPKEAKELSDLHQKMVQKDELQKGKWNYRNLQKLTIRQKTNQKEKFPVHKQLLCRTLDLLESKEKPLPLLSTPTHIPMFIAPATLIERLKQYQQANAEPDDMDMQTALESGTG